MPSHEEAWIDLVIARSSDLRRAGVLSIGISGCVASFGPADPEPTTDDDSDPVIAEPLNPWEDPASYPSGFVPTLDIEDLSREERRRR